MTSVCEAKSLYSEEQNNPNALIYHSSLDREQHLRDLLMSILGLSLKHESFYTLMKKES